MRIGIGSGTSIGPTVRHGAGGAVATPALAVADDFATLAADAAITGRTTSDGLGTWATGADLVGDGSGRIYYQGTTATQCLLTSPTPATANQKASFDLTLALDGRSPQTAGVSRLGVCLKQSSATGAVANHIRVYYSLVNDVETISLDEVFFSIQTLYDAIPLPAQAPGAVVHVDVAVSAGTLTVTVSGALTATKTMVLTRTASDLGSWGIYAHRTSTVAVSATVGWHLGALSFSEDRDAPAAAYAIAAARLVRLAGIPPVSSKVPTAWAVPQLNSGYVGYPNNGRFAVCLDGPAPAGGFAFTPTFSGTLYDAAGAAIAPPLVIPADSDAASFAVAPLSGHNTGNLTIAGTNNLGFVNPSGLTLPYRANVAIIAGDSITERQQYGYGWYAAIEATLGTTWNVVCESKSSSRLVYNEVQSLSILHRGQITWATAHDASRLGKEGLILWAGTNDLIAAGTTTADVRSRLAQVIAQAQTAGWSNIAVVTMLSFNNVYLAGKFADQAAFEVTRQQIITDIKADYGATGSDTSVSILDIGSDADLGAPDAYARTEWFPDGLHPYGTGTYGGKTVTGIVAPYVSGWLGSL